jgi:lysophospholipase L1-like esterase
VGGERVAYVRWLGRIALGAGVAGAVGGAAGVGTVTLMKRQAEHARQVIGKPLGEIALRADRTYKKSYGDRLDLLIVGDSIAAGLGAYRKKTTLAGRIARELAKETHRTVRVTSVAEVGAETWMIPERQLPRLKGGYRPDIAVVIVGGNDVIHRRPATESIESLVAVIEDLHLRGANVVVGTCPDLGAIGPVKRPLKSYLSHNSKSLAAAQAEAALAHGARVVSLAKAVGPHFADNPDEMFSIDRFHPSELGYKRTAQALLPSLLAALGLPADVPHGHYAPEEQVVPADVDVPDDVDA